MVITRFHTRVTLKAMDAQQVGAMQMQLHHNAEDLQTYLKDLQNWEDEIKVKDRNLSKQKPILKEVKDDIEMIVVN